MCAMNMMQEIYEGRILDRWNKLLPRNPIQLNSIHETDAELLPLVGTDKFLAITVDSIMEEIVLGFYKEPETIGWMGAMSSLSDLAAVGASPLGVVMSVSLPKENSEKVQEGIALGLRSACEAVGTYVLGGDTNFSDMISITGCAVGVVEESRLLRRKGCGASEWLFASGPLGAGSALAASVLFGLSSLYTEQKYRPMARIREAGFISGVATCCMDTSDGLVATLDQLMRINAVGFELDSDLFGFLDATAGTICQALDLSPLMMLAGHHGEFELVFTVRDEQVDQFEKRAHENAFCPVRIGKTIEEPVIRVGSGKKGVIDSAKILNLASTVSNDLRKYVQDLQQLVPSIKTSTKKT